MKIRGHIKFLVSLRRALKIINNTVAGQEKKLRKLEESAFLLINEMDQMEKHLDTLESKTRRFAQRRGMTSVLFLEEL